VTAQEAQGAIDRASLVSMIRARLKESVFRPGDYLFRSVSGAVLGRVFGREAFWCVCETPFRAPF